MKTYLTLSAIALAAAATLSSGTVLAQAAAPAAAPEFAVTGNFGITSDYRFRGLSQNNLDPAFQGGFDVAHSSGLYIGTWGSNVSRWAATDTGSLELDLYGGYKFEVAGMPLDIGVISYMYPSSLKNGKVNTQEAYVGTAFGPATFKVSYVIGEDYFGSTADGKNASGTTYYDLTLGQEIAPKLTASIHAGYTDYKESAFGYSDSGKMSYSDYNVGLAYDLNGFILSAKYYWNDAKTGTKAYADASSVGGNSKLYKDGFAVSVLKAF
jgi:uncharacterized protein (TIGR02001 family)